MTACAGSIEKQEAAQDNRSANTQSSPIENPLSPGNLPPPVGTSQSLSLNEGNAFFQRKEVWDSFSPQLKQKVYESYSKGGSAKNENAYDTLFGKVIIEEKPEWVLLEGGELMTQTFAISSDPCGTGATFLCVSTPHEHDGVVSDVMHVDGALKMREVAFFGVLDPVAMVSIFKQPASGSLQRVGEFPILPSDLAPVNYQAPRASGASSDEPPIEVGPFQKAVPLSGPGVYQIIVSAWKNTETGAQLDTKRFTIYRQSIPRFAQGGVRVYPANRSSNTCDTQHPIAIGASAVNVSDSDICIETKLQDEGTPNVGVIIDDDARDANNNLVMLYSGSGKLLAPTSDPTTHQPIITTLVPLYAGFNHFKVKVQNTLLATSPIPNEAQQEFELVNSFAAPSLKFSDSSVQDGKIVEAGAVGASVLLQFCITSDGVHCITDLPATSKPDLTFNNISIPADQVNTGTSGQVIVALHPFVGANTFSIKAPSGSTAPFPEYKASFGFGKVNKLYENGQLKEQDNFLKRGLSLEINKNIFSVQLKHVLENYLNSNAFKSSIKNAISQEPSPEIQCNEFDRQPIDASGGEALIFTNDPSIGSVEVNQIEPTSQNALLLQLTINTFSAQANLLGTIPVDINIRKLIVKMGVRFNKNSKGVNNLDIFALERDSSGRDKVLDIVGSDGVNGFIRVAVERQPAARYFQHYEALLSSNFYSSISKTILCGVEDKINNSQTGLARWFNDLPRLINYNSENPFRAPLQFELMGRQIGIDIAYDVLHAQEISFSNRGLKIVNVPLRFTPGPLILGGIPEAIRHSVVGSLSSPDLNPEPSAASPETNENRNLSLGISEEAINQAIFAANFAGMLDIAIDPNFFTNNGIPFIDQVTPTVGDLVLTGTSDHFFDLNQNGINDDNPLPIMLKLTTDKHLPPTLHFLNSQEINFLAEEVRKKRNGENTPSDQLKTLNPELTYFKFTISNLDIAVFRVLPFPQSLNGYKTFCTPLNPQRKSSPEDLVSIPPISRQGSNPENGFGSSCEQTISEDYEITSDGSCAPGFKAFTSPVRNGQIISSGVGAEVPLLRYKLSLTLYGAFEKTYREILLKDKYRINTALNSPPTFTEVENPKSTNFLRIKIVAVDPLKPQVDLKVVENHSALSNADLEGSPKFSPIVNVAIGTNCDKFNEIRIPIPDKFVDDPAVEGDFMEKFKEFGIQSLDFGDEVAELPTLERDSSALYLDLTAHLGVGYLFSFNPGVIPNFPFHETGRQSSSTQH